MTIEVTSVPDRRGRFSPRKIARRFLVAVRSAVFGEHWIIFRSLVSIFAIALIVSGYSLRRSYNYYSQIIDARLARGYLTSRPGLYAAPTTLRAGQGVSLNEVVLKLQRAGYVESRGSDVWSGSFNRFDQEIEIRPTTAPGSVGVAPVHVIFDDKSRIVGLKTDGAHLDSFTLEPEVLTNDVLVKTGQRRTLSYNEIPPVFVHAILSIEDRRFFEHPGLDLFGVARAVLRNAGDERIGQGGSTITQQLVKNTYLSSEKTLRRKYAEAMLAFALERRLSKQDIFALYCNEIFLGQRGDVAVRGIEQASHVYFGKEPKDLSLTEAATVAGMIQGPSRYSPVRHPAAARERRNLVLAAMVHESWITADQASTAENETINPAPTENLDSLAPYFVDYVNRVAESQFAISDDEQRVYTTIDLDLQKLAEAALKRQLDRLDTVYKNAAAKPQVALVALDPHSGNVLAMVGGRDYASSQLNRATDAHRQPGSTFKPFVYAAALEDGMSPMTMFTDAPCEFVYDGNKTYRPLNFGGGYSMRDVTMRAGLVNSLNTVTVAVAMQTGLARIANLSARFGLPKPQRYPALALGTSEVTPLQLAGAYATFVNGGRRVEPKVISGISDQPETSSGGEGQASQVISPTTAYMITNMLSAVVDHGTARVARGAVKGAAIAGKTGTSRDGWFVGYTPNLVCAVWIGFDDNKQLGLTGATAALPVWAEFMNSAVARRPELGGRGFECPEGIKFVEIDNDTGLISTLTCPHRELIAVTESLAPHLECYLHGNLPVTSGEDKTVTINLPTAVAGQRAPRPPSVPMDPRILRIEVDGKGRRTLVNEMR